MSKALTEQQKLATQPDVSARVMANAGAGKTFVLTTRVLRLLLNGVHPGKILCLTYTKAAASEMRERINKRLEDWVLMDDDKLRRELAALIESEPDEKQLKIAKKLFSSTLEASPPPRIQTIHSFCQDVLKRFPLESGIQPYFEVADDITSKELIKETTQILLSNHQQEPEVSEAIDYIAAVSSESKFDDVVSEIITQRNRIKDLFESANSPSGIIDAVYARHNVRASTDPRTIISEFMQFSPEKLSALEQMMHAFSGSAAATDVKNLALLSEAILARDFELYKQLLFVEKGTPRTQRSLITQKALAAFTPGWEWIAREQEMLGRVIEELNIIENLKFTSQVIYLAYGILDTYDALKRSQAVIDYNDLIYSTKKLFTTSDNTAWVLYKLDGGIDHILVDEAQDTSPEQWQIILALLEEFMAGEGVTDKERTVFIVGDEKQSIYSFQGADQKMFKQVVDRISDMVSSAQKKFTDIQLQTSFRSVDAVLKLTDATFEPEHLRNSVTSSIKAIQHLLDRKDEGGHVEIWPLIKNEEKEELENWQLPVNYHSAKSADLLLAEKIADTIADWIGSGRVLASTGKPVRPADILILLRSRGDMADMLINRLKRRNIAVSGSDRLKITDHIAIQDLLSLGNFLLLPDDDLSLAEILKSPLFGISEEDLFELCYKRESSLWNRLRENKKFAAYSETLSMLLGRTDFDSVYKLYSLVLDQLGGRKKLIARLGVEVNDVLDEFLNLAVNFERSHTSSLQHFISWVGISSMEIKRDMEASNDEVRIMTVHGAKGLEAPIVFLADTAKSPKSKRQRQLFWDDEYFYCYKSSSQLSSNLRAIVDLAKAAAYDEYLRLLYVAVTRARDELYICGSMGEREVNIDELWYKLVENALHKIGVKDEVSGVIRYQTPQRKIIAPPEAEEKKIKTQMPAFLNQKLPREVSETVDIEEVYDFSEKTEQVEYGKKVHKVLEVISFIPPDKRQAYLLDKFPSDKKTRGEILHLLEDPELKGIFSANAKAEVSIIGKSGGKIITGRIDRLVVTEAEIKIIDFKTSRNIPAQVPESYKIQLDTYASIIAKKYPAHKIRKYILWTAEAKLTELA